MNDDLKQVTSAFQNFLSVYAYFRKKYGLTKKISNIHEICNAMTDKHGRICRYIKHQERKDPKPDWPEGMTEAMTGYLAYMTMVLEYYNVSIEKGMENEIGEAIKQHGKRK